MELGEGGTVHTVLLVEDDEHVRELLAATVPSDWRIVEAADGIEALALAQEHHPDAVVLDHDLPLLDGAAVCAALRRSPDGATMRIVALTAHHDDAVREAFTAAGVDAVLHKPFSPMRLMELLERWGATLG